jgi:hypothetical protein
MASDYGVELEALGQRGRNIEVLSVSAWRARRLTSATLRKMASLLRLSVPSASAT